MGKLSQARHMQIRKYIVTLASHAVKEEPIPSERELAEMFQTTRETVRVSLTRLVAEKYLLRFPRRGYFLNPASSNTYLRKRKIIGLICHSGELAFYDDGLLRLIREVAEAFVERSWLLQMLSTSRETLVNDICNSKLDGLIWLHGDWSIKEFEAISREGSIPVVGLFNELSPGAGSYVFLNHYEEFYLRTKYLLSCGCKNIASGAYCKNCVAGYRAALEENGIPYDPALVFPGRALEENIEKLWKEKKPDGVSLRINDLAAVTEFAKKNSLEIPRDIQLIMDDFKTEENFTHTVKPVRDVVKTLCCKLELLMEGKDASFEDPAFQWSICKGTSTLEK